MEFGQSSFGGIDFEKQYASAYFVRLESLRAAVMSAARDRWVATHRISENQLVGNVKSYKSDSQEIVLVGVMFKDMCLKPNVLSDIQNSLSLSDQWLLPPDGVDVARKVSDSDVVYLEDMEARIQLVFEDNSVPQSFPTGIVVAVLGCVNQHGFFNVHDYVLPGCQSPSSALKMTDEPSYVAMVSGLQIGSPSSNPLSLQLLRDFLMGTSGSDEDTKLASQIVRVIVAGDSLFYKPDRDPSATSMQEADIFFSELASVLPVDVMSGARDPTNYCLPQQPLHSGLFPEARRYANMNVKTNPFKLKLGEMVLLGTSGQNLTDILQYTNLESGLDALDLVAKARHLAPTAPDTLACYPFTMTDPLIVSENNGGCPHVIFSGNQTKTESRMVDGSGVRIATISDFSLSPSILLLNVCDIEDVKIIEFCVQDMI